MRASGDSTTLRPLGRWVVVELDDPDRVTESGLVIPDDAQREPTFGTVLAAGPGSLIRTTKQERKVSRDEYKYIGVPCAKGDRVYCGAFNGWEVPRKLTGGKYWRIMDAAQDIYLVEKRG